MRIYKTNEESEKTEEVILLCKQHGDIVLCIIVYFLGCDPDLDADFYSKKKKLL